MNRKPKLGERLVAEIIYRNSESKITDVKVIRVGTKHFDVARLDSIGHTLTTNLIKDWSTRVGSCNIGINAPIHIFETREQIAAKNEHQARANALWMQFRYSSDWLKVDPEKLKAITEILGL